MSDPLSKSSKPLAATFNERLNEQLINCLNVQTSVIQNLSQYSQHISLQLFEIKNIVEILSNRVFALQQQFHQQPHYAPNHYPSPMYPNYPSQQPIPVTPATTVSHHAPPLFPVPPPSVPTRLPAPPTSSTTFGNSVGTLFVPNNVNPPVSSTSNPPPFQFSQSGMMPTVQSTNTNTYSQPTASIAAPNLFSSASSSKTVGSNPLIFSTAETNTKSSLISSAASNGSTNEKPVNTTSVFRFGTNNTTSSSFPVNGFSSIPTITSPKTCAKADDEEESDEEPYEPEISAKIVSLPVVEVKTGEEDENILFCERAKLYRFDTGSNQMKERGIGEMKILQHKTQNTCRILMRREQVLKLCANHQITAQMELKPHQGSENVYVWSAMDFADGEAKHETFCVRFKTNEQAKNFLNEFNKAKDINSKKSGDMPPIQNITLKDKETKQNSAANDNDVIAIDEVKPSAEQIDRAKKLQLPETFFLYENKEPCKGCAGCENDTPSIGTNENKTISKPTDPVKNDTKMTSIQTPSTASGPKTPLSSSENIKFSFNNAKIAQPETQPQLQKQSSTKSEKSSEEASIPASNITQQYENKPSIFGGANTTTGTSIFGGFQAAANSGGSIFGGSPSLKSQNNSTGFSFPGFGNPSSPSNGFSFSSQNLTTSTTATATTTTTTTTPSNSSSTFSFGSSNKPLFGTTTGFSFADLAKQTTTSANDKSTSNGTGDRVFVGQGSLVFGTSAANTSVTTQNNNDDDDGETGGADDESYEPNVSFKPIVKLSAIEVKTGEEDENILFCERAKLYRFDTDSNQMKERGIGEMKILQHKTQNTCRILMRREQVLKLCANHQITAQMELKPHQGSENAYVWSAMDFADGEAKHETLCVRFKSADAAKRFVKHFNEAKQACAKAQA